MLRNANSTALRPNIFSNLSSRQQNPLNEKMKFRQLESRNLFEKKPPRAHIFRYFRYESQNSKASLNKTYFYENQSYESKTLILQMKILTLWKCLCFKK